MKSNFILQSIIMIIAVFIVLLSLADPDYLGGLLLLQIPVGIIQYISSTFTFFVLTDVRGFNLFRTHWILSTIYLIGFISFAASELSIDSFAFVIVSLLIIPWSLATLYWYCTFIASGFKDKMSLSKLESKEQQL